MTKNLISILTILLSVVVTFSCTDRLEEFDSAPAVIGADKVSVALELGVAEMVSDIPETKAGEASPGISNEIKNFCILQYAGTDDDAQLVGEVQYIERAPDFIDGNTDTYNGIGLINSAGAQHTVVFLANTFSIVPRYNTLGEMLDQTRWIESQQDLFSCDPSETNSVLYPRMNAIAVSTISGDTHITALLRRSMARVNVNLTNTGADGLVLKSVQLCNIPHKDYYVSDYRYNASDNSLRETAFHSQNDPMASETFDYPIFSLDSPVAGSQSQTITFYMSCNQRGTIDNDTVVEKNCLRPSTDASYIKIVACYGPEHDKDIVYTFYLGSDMERDFNVNPNTSYNLSIPFNGMGDVQADARIVDYGGIDFEVDSNCYILNPPPYGICSYSFNVVHRANTFWGPRYGLDKDARYAGNYINTNDTWHARIIWTDFEMTQEEAIRFLPRTSGTGGGSYMDDCQRITVNIQAGHPGGSALIGIYKDDPENILWSWHLWITDYQPDNIAGVAPVDGKYVYKVPGGEVHRYGSAKADGTETIWATGRQYENAFIMDRELGSLSQAVASQKRFKFYQFGRKDPFNMSCSVWTYSNILEPTKGDPIRYIEKSVLDEPAVITDGSSNGGMNTGGMNVPYAVSHPSMMIAGDYWTDAGQFRLTGNMNLQGKEQQWFDPDSSERDSDHEEVTSGGSFYTDAAHTKQDIRVNKSFFDPCPPGWRLPVKQTWEMFYGDNQGKSTIDEKCNFQYGVDDLFGNRGNGRTYVPLGFLSQKDNKTAQTIFFPLTGVYYLGRGIVNIHLDGYLYSCNAPYALFWRVGTTLTQESSQNLCSANTTRCIKEE